MRLRVARSAFEILPETVGQFGTVIVEDSPGGALNFFNQSVQVIARA